MSSLDIHGTVVMIFIAALAVNQGWTVFIVGMIIVAALQFLWAARPR